VLVRFDQVAGAVINANHAIMSPAAMLRVADCMPDRVRSFVPQREFQLLVTPVRARYPVQLRVQPLLNPLLIFVLRISFKGLKPCRGNSKLDEKALKMRRYAAL
jgi:hypothetical protein